MPHLTATAKHAILLEYAPRSSTHSFAALARRHSVKGGWRTIKNWHDRWDGTVQSLEREQGSGRPRILSSREVQQHIHAPILAANREHRAIHYTDLKQPIQQATGKNPSLRTIQRYGEKELEAKKKHTKKRTATESECRHACVIERASVCIEYGADEADSFLSVT